VHGEPPTLNDDVPPQLRQIVGRALAKTPEERYQSAAEMIRDLKQAAAPREWESGPAMTVGESSVAVSPERPQGRRPVWLYPAVAAYVLFFSIRFFCGVLRPRLARLAGAEPACGLFRWSAV